MAAGRGDARRLGYRRAPRAVQSCTSGLRARARRVPASKLETGLLGARVVIPTAPRLPGPSASSPSPVSYFSAIPPRTLGGKVAL